MEEERILISPKWLRVEYVSTWGNPEDGEEKGEGQRCADFDGDGKGERRLNKCEGGAWVRKGGGCS